MSIPRIAISLLTVFVLAVISAQAGEVPPPVTDADRVATFLLHGNSNARSFVASNVNEAALDEAAREWLSKADKRKVSALAAVVIPGSNGERSLVTALSAWTGERRIKAENEKIGAPDFLAAAADQAEKLLADPAFKKDVEAASLGFDQTQSIERARQLSGRGVRSGVGVFGADRSAGSVGGGRDGSGNGNEASRTNTTATEGRMLTKRLADGQNPTEGGENPATPGPMGAELRARTMIASLPPAANLPLNLRNRPNFEVPSPGADAVGTMKTNALDSTTFGSEAEKKSAVAGEIGEAKLRAVFDATVARLNKEGKRRAGKGSFNGVVNNLGASYGPGVKYIRCYDQAEELLGDLEKAVPAKSGWSFRIATYTGEGHEANGHYWVNAVSKKNEQPSLIMDAWLGEIKTDPSKNPIVIKPFMAWAIGATMDKILPQ